MCSTPLTEAQEQLLAHWPNLAISPKCLPIGEYITAVEQTCLSLTPGEGRGTVGRGEGCYKEDSPP